MRYPLLVILLVVSVTFSVLNATPVTVNLLLWRGEMLLAVAVMVAMAVGVLLGALLMLPWGVRSRRGMKQAQRSAHDLQKRLHSAEAAAQSRAMAKLPAPSRGVAGDEKGG